MRTAGTHQFLQAPDPRVVCEQQAGASRAPFPAGHLPQVAGRVEAAGREPYLVDDQVAHPTVARHHLQYRVRGAQRERQMLDDQGREPPFLVDPEAGQQLP
jgi:hypothetical protein